MKKLLRCILVTALVSIMIFSFAASVYAFNGVPAGTGQTPPKLSNYTQANNLWTPFGIERFDLWQHPGSQTFQNHRLYPKPDGLTLPPMGWNSWNPIGTNITATIIKDIADQIANVGGVNSMDLIKCGYQYVVIDDGCYASGSTLAPNSSFSSYSFGGDTGFKGLSNYVHSLGLKYGMYNDSGSSTCGGQPGAYPAAGGREDAWAKNMTDWGVDFLKYDYCSNPWGIQSSNYIGGGPDVQSMVVTNASSSPTFSHTTNWGATTAPSNVTYGGSASRNSGGFLAGLGQTTYQSYVTPTFVPGAAYVRVDNVPAFGTYNLDITRRNSTTGSTTGGRYLMIDVNGERQFEIFGSSSTSWVNTGTNAIPVTLKAGTNYITLYNTKQQEIGLYCYTAFRDGLQKNGGQNIGVAMCDWGYTGPWQYGQTIGESCRVMQDIFTGSGGGTGQWTWTKMQYDRASYLAQSYGTLGGVWLDPDMLVVGLGSTRTSGFWTTAQNRQHFDAWAILNAPLMLGMDLRDSATRTRVQGIIDNRNIIANNQDPLGIPGKRIKVSSGSVTGYNTSSRVDVIAKPCANGDVSVYFGAWSANTTVTLNMNEVVNGIGDVMINRDTFAIGTTYYKNLNTGAIGSLTNATSNLSVSGLATDDSVTYRFSKTPFTTGLNTDSVYGVGLSFDQVDFIGGKIQVGTSNGTNTGTPVYYQNRAIGLATINNNTGATVNAAIKLELFDAKGALVAGYPKVSPTKAIETGWLVPWEFKVDLPDIVAGNSMTATLIDADTGVALAPSYTRYAPAVEPSNVKLDYYGSELNVLASNNPASSSKVSSKDSELVGTNPVVATGTIYNDTSANIRAQIVTTLHNANGSVAAGPQLSPITTVVPQDSVVLTDLYMLPSTLEPGMYARSYVIDADTALPITSSATLPESATGIFIDPANFVGNETVTAYATFNNLSAAALNAVIRFELFNAANVLIDTDDSAIEVIAPNDMGVWSYAYTAPAKVYGYTLKATVINYDADLALTDSAIAKAPDIPVAGVVFSPAALLKNDEVIVTSTLYNPGVSDIDVRTKFELYNNDDVLVDTRYSDTKKIGSLDAEVWIYAYDNLAKVFGYKLKATIVDAVSNAALSDVFTAEGPEVPDSKVDFGATSSLNPNDNTIVCTAWYYNDGTANVSAKMKIELFDNKGELRNSAIEPTATTILPADAEIWNYDLPWALPAKVLGYELRITLVDATAEAALLPSFSLYGPNPLPTSLGITLTGNVATVSATVFNLEYEDLDAVILFARYDGAGNLLEAKRESAVLVESESALEFNATFVLPTDQSLAAFLLDGDTNKKLCDAAFVGDAVDPYTVNIASKYGASIVANVSSTAHALYENDSGVDLKASVIISRYDSDKRLAEVIFGDPVDVKAGAVAYIAAPYTAPADADGQTVKSFLWHSVTFAPLVKNAEQSVFDLPSTNTAALELAIEQADPLNPARYSSGTFDVLATALANAKDVFADLYASQSEINAATEELTAAIGGLATSPKLVNLNQLLTQAKAVNLSGYNLLSGYLMTNAISDGQEVYDDLLCTETELDAAISSLTSANAGLTAAPGGLKRIGPVYRRVGTTGNNFEVNPNVTDYVPATGYGESTYYSAGYGWQRLFDGTRSGETTMYFYDSNTATNAYGGFDLGAGNEVTINRIRYSPRTGTYAIRANNCTFRASNSTSNGTGSSTTLLGTITGLSTSSTNAWIEMTPANTTTKFRYVWFQSNATNSYGNLGEAEFYTMVNVLDKSLLDAKVTDALTLAEIDYSPTSWTAFEGALTAAQAAQAYTDIADQTAVNAAANALIAAINALEPA